MMKIVLSKLILLAIVASIPKIAAADDPKDILIVVNTSVKVDRVTAGELRNLFLKNKSNWSSGQKAVPIHAPRGTEIRDEVRDRLLGMAETDEKSYWQDQKIKKGTTEPVEFENTLKAVFKLRGSVGYVYRSSYREGVVKIVLVLPAKGN